MTAALIAEKLEHRLCRREPPHEYFRDDDLSSALAVVDELTEI